MPVNGLVTITPTSIVSTGTGNSSSINTNGSVTFESCETLSLNGVFTSSYDNYMISIRTQNSASSLSALYARLRANGTDDVTASGYSAQTINVQGTTISGLRVTGTSGIWGATSATRRDGITVYLFGPQLAQSTVWRGVNFVGDAGGTVYDVTGTHTQATSYDGFTIYPSTNTISGLITVYGFNQ